MNERNVIERIYVPDVGEAQDVEVVELLIAVGDVIEADSSIVVLESDKASMEIPSPCAGRVVSIAIAEGDKVEEGSLLIELETEAEVEAEKGSSVAASAKKALKESVDEDKVVPRTASSDKPESASMVEPQVERSHVVLVPDVGDAQEVVIVEILVHQGDEVKDGDSLVVLESDKASMEIPADMSGVVQQIMVNEGDEVREGDELVTLVGTVPFSEVQASEPVAPAVKVDPPPTGVIAVLDQDASRPVSKSAPVLAVSAPSKGDKVHAGPAVRKQAREYGVDILSVKGSGRKGRILKEDIQLYVKESLGKTGASNGAGIPEIPEIDFSKFGETEVQPFSRIRKASARNLHRSWLNVPHVTQFDEADITDLEIFRREQNLVMKSEGTKLTPLAFLVRAVVDALKKYPQFNASLSAERDALILKRYCNIGIAVETQDGLVVPVLKDADKKGVVQLAEESAELAGLARESKLPMDAMQGATFTISSLGGIGGTAFTPIVNAPEVAILGVSRSKVAPAFNGESFEPRTMLPLSLSYDHRAIDGAEAARFTSHLRSVLSDLRKMIL